MPDLNWTPVPENYQAAYLVLRDILALCETEQQERYSEGLRRRVIILAKKGLPHNGKM